MQDNATRNVLVMTAVSVLGMAVLPACGCVSDGASGRQLHGAIVVSAVVLGTLAPLPLYAPLVWWLGFYLVRPSWRPSLPVAAVNCLLVMLTSSLLLVAFEFETGLHHP